MATNKPKKPGHIPQEVLEYWKPLFRKGNNLDHLLSAVCKFIRDELLWALPPPDPPDIVQAYTKLLGRQLSQAILDKLTRQYRRTRTLPPDRLLQSFPKRATALFSQALNYLVEVWLKDIMDFPQSTLAGRVQRLAPRLSALPNLRGRSALGKIYLLRCFIEYERLLALLKEDPVLSETKRWKYEDEKFKRFESYPAGCGARFAALSELCQDHKIDVPSHDLERWASHPPAKIALLLTIAWAKALPGLSPHYLKSRVFPEMRRWAKALDTLPFPSHSP